MRLVDAAEAVSGIKSGQQVYVHAAAAVPSSIIGSHTP